MVRATARSEVVTVVVPTRNRLPVLRRTLGSVLAQRGVDVRLVVVDEGSSDGTTEELRALAARDGRVRLVRHDEPRGLPAARNAGTAVADTAWVAWCDDDDVWAPTKLARQLEAATTAGAGWSCTGSVFVTGPGLTIIGHQRIPPGTDVGAELLRANVVPGGGSGVLARRDLVSAVGGFDESLRSSEDWDLWIRLARASAVAVVDEPLVGYRIWRGSMSTDVARMRASRTTVLARHGEGADAEADAAYERFLAKQLLRNGEGRAAAGRFLELAVGHHAWGELARVVPAFVAPGLTDRWGTARARRRIPPGWLAAADAWLRALPPSVPVGAGALSA